MSDPTPTISFSEQTKVRLPLLVLVALLAATVTATVTWATLRADVAAHGSTLTGHEARLKELEKAQADLAVIKNDVSWLRQREEKRLAP